MSTPLRIRRTRASGEIQVTVTVRAVVVEEEVTPEHLLQWVQEAVARHHTARAGFITTDDGVLGGIKPPQVTGS